MHAAVTEMWSNGPVEGQVNRLRGDDMVVPRDDCTTIPFGVGLFPFISTNDRYRHYPASYKPKCIKNHVGLHLVWGRVDQLQGIDIALGGTEVLEHTEGAQIAIGINRAKQLEGAEVAVGMNVARRMKGAQVAVGPNLVLEHFTGAQVALINDDQVVQAIPSDRSDQAFDVGVLPWRPRCRWSIPDPHGVQPPLENLAKGLVTVSNEMARRPVPGKGLGDLM